MINDEIRKAKIAELWEDIHCILSIIGYSFNKNELPFYIATEQTIIEKIERNIDDDKN